MSKERIACKEYCECGMTNIDCGYAGYKTPKEIELEKQVGRLQEQLAIATKALKKYMTFCRHPAEEALKEMEGVK